MRRLNTLLFVFSVAACSAGCAAAGGSSPPRGVAPEFEKYFKDTKTFSCISHPDIQIPFKSVNDDYCDCPDGSDEPGTSACAHIATDKSPLPGFYCRNKGHNPSFLSFQRVNDGVCDYELCCDGSDEWAHVGGIKCEDRCKAIGKKWRQDQEERTKALSAAVQKRKELVQTASRQRREVQDRIGDLETEVQAAQLKVTVLKSELAKVRAEEKQKAAKRGPKKKSGKEAHVLAGLAKKRIDEMREALLVLKRAYDDDHARVLELQGILRGLKLGYDPNFNDYAVKRAVRSWEEFDVRENDASGRWPKPAIPDVGKLAEEDGPTSGINFQAWEAPEPEEKTLVEQILPPFLATIVPETIDKVGRWLAENGVIAPRHDDSDEPRAVREARERLEAEEGTLMNTQSKLGEYKEDLSKDFGKDDVFRALKDTCISKDSGEYTYELCWMDQTKQKSKKGGGVTNMGNYEGVTTVTVDETSAEGLVVPREKIALEFSNGHTCWNGPPRSTKVILECGAVDEILKITEDEKCVYSMQVITPAVCELLTDGKPAGGRKDEL